MLQQTNLVRCLETALLFAALLFGQRPETLPEAEGRAREMLAKGNAAGALAVYEDAARRFPSSARIQDDCGFVLAAQQRYPEAIADSAVRWNWTRNSPWHTTISEWLTG